VGAAGSTLGTNCSCAGSLTLSRVQSVILPLLRRPILSAALLVFLFDFASFGVILMLGGRTYQTLEVAVYTQALHFLNLPMAGLLSIFQLGCTLAVTLIYSHLNRGKSVPLFHACAAKGTQAAHAGRTFDGVSYRYIPFPFTGASADRAGNTLCHSTGGGSRAARGSANRSNARVLPGVVRQYEPERVFYVPPAVAVGNSLQYAGMTTIISTLAGTLLAYAMVKKQSARRWLDAVVMLPFGASAVTLGLGFIVAFSGTPLTDSSFPWLIPLAHSLIAMPFVLRVVQPALASIPVSLGQTAAVLGASPLRVWWEVEMKLISRAMISAALFPLPFAG